ncbi:hypothetical protein ACJ6WF_21160 [Streptomyces sp. MMS24-I2-30]|uniref:hypothetical protein n=1 Tax=Streptomyces sp. MMS24-I2-30 TaxID=3351564 RepID=UPI0038968E2B
MSTPGHSRRSAVESEFSLSDWRLAENLPARFGTLAAVLQVLIPGVRKPSSTSSAARN